MRLMSRRAVLTAGVAGAVATAVGGVSAAHASATEVTLWRLNPDWGEPLTTDTGSSTKTRCKGKACHKAAPHRFFLTRADALAGRLHPCCLAQPVAVKVCIDLNELMPYYTANLGGVDGRCPTLPTNPHDALYAAGACVPSSGPPPADGDPPLGGAPPAGGGALPITGSSTGAVVLGAAVALAAGGALTVAGRRPATDGPSVDGPAVERADDPTVG